MTQQRIIAVDESIPLYALKYALDNNEPDAVNYICNRLIETVPQMLKPLTLWCKQAIDDYLASNDPTYLKGAPIKRLQEMLVFHLKEFRE